MTGCLGTDAAFSAQFCFLLVLREVAIKISKIRYQSVGGTLGRKAKWDGKRFGLPNLSRLIRREA
jgi:hypothetical protein